MTDDVYLVFNMKGVVAMTKRRPKLAPHEYAVAVQVNVPDEFFADAIPRAVLDLPADAAIRPPITVAAESSYARTFGGLAKLP